MKSFAAFLDLNRPDELKPEVAEWGRMRLRTLISQLSDEEKRELTRFLKDERDRAGGMYREWIEDLPERLGIAVEA